MFDDRLDAGRQLGALLATRKFENPLVIGLARGGVPVARAVADLLGAPLDVMVVRKIGAPGNPEYAIGAVAAGITLIDERTIRMLGVSPQYLDAEVADQLKEMERRESTYRQGRAPIEVTGRTVIVVDDGLATGSTARVAIEAIRRRNPARVVLAVPVCAADTAAKLRQIVELVAVLEPRDFQAVGLWYHDFRPTTDAEVLRSLQPAGPASARADGPGQVPADHGKGIA